MLAPWAAIRRKDLSGAAISFFKAVGYLTCHACVNFLFLWGSSEEVLVEGS